MTRTLEELRSIIGKNLDDLQNKELSDYERNIVVQRAQETAALSKQMNNIAKLYLNADQMSGRTDRIDDIIGMQRNVEVDKAIKEINK